MDTVLLPTEAQIYGAIEEIYSQGIRRPGYAADRWAEEYCKETFTSLGLERVRLEPVELPYWEPKRGVLTILSDDSTAIEGFPMPHFTTSDGLEAPLVLFDEERPEAVKDAIALVDLPLQRPRHTRLAELATWVYDPRDTFSGSRHILPFPRGAQTALDPAIKAGAVGVVGILTDYPGDSSDYYVPYDAIERGVPGVWIKGSEGARLKELIATSDVRGRIEVDAVREMITTYNVIGELPGADDEFVIIGSHHDGPWASAVEDASGMALVFAQAAYWRRIPVFYRPHKLMFLLNSGHMAGAAGLHAFVEAHADDLERTVLEIHLEHAAVEFTDGAGEPMPTGHPEARWWFTSRAPLLERAVREAVHTEQLDRSLIMPPTAFGPAPTTDGSAFYTAGVPIVNFLTAPYYLFDAQDTLDKVHRPSLIPITRAAVRIIDSTAGITAREMRAAVNGG